MEKYVHERIPGSIVHYCEFKNPKDQIYSEMYPEFAKVEEMGENKNNDPSIYFMCEYAHSMGIGLSLIHISISRLESTTASASPG